MRRAILCVLAVLLTLCATAQEQRKCPQGDELRKRAKHTEGWYGNGLTWSSLAIPEAGSADSYCYERTIRVTQPTLVDWPIAGMYNTVVEKEFTVSTCCEGGARAEDGPLEIGTLGRRIRTKVYRFRGEPTAQNRWSSITGVIVADAKPVLLDLQIQRTPTSTTIVNNGDELYAAEIMGMTTLPLFVLPPGTTRTGPFQTITLCAMSSTDNFLAIP